MKSLYSIWKKMVRKEVPVTQVRAVHAVHAALFMLCMLCTLRYALLSAAPRSLRCAVAVGVHPMPFQPLLPCSYSFR